MARLITRRLLLGRALLAGLTLAATGAGQADVAGRAKGAAATAREPARREPLVFAAASLSEALEEVGRAFTAATGVRGAASYAACSVRAKQIAPGAPRERAGGACLRGARRSPARHRVQNRREGREAGARRRCFPRGQPSAHHVRAGADRTCASRGRAARGVPDGRRCAADLRAL